MLFYTLLTYPVGRINVFQAHGYISISPVVKSRDVWAMFFTEDENFSKNHHIRHFHEKRWILGGS